jgi:hypothetical protein
MELVSPRAKFERARVHRRELFEAGLTWLKANASGPMPMGKRVEPWIDGGEVIIYSGGTHPAKVDDGIALMLGDALNDYRASLDHLAWLLVPESEKAKGKVAENIYFPVSGDKSKFRAQIATKMPKVDDVTRSIVERHQPFRNHTLVRDHPLWILHHWNNLDKHRTLPVIAVGASNMTAKSPPSFENFEVFEQKFVPNHLYLLPGTDLFWFYGRRRNPKKDHGVMVKWSGSVWIAHESGRSLEVALNQIDAAVEAVLMEFESLPARRIGI